MIVASLSLSCNKDELECCFEPAGGAHYFINNLTSSNLKVMFVTSEELGLKTIDSISTIPPNNKLKIFEDGIIGVIPVPSNSFSSLTFLRASDSSEFILSDDINSNWEVLSRDFESGEYGLTEYELKIDDSMFD